MKYIWLNDSEIEYIVVDGERYFNSNCILFTNKEKKEGVKSGMVNGEE